MQDAGPKGRTLADLWNLYKERHVQAKGAINTNSSKFSWRRLEPHFGKLCPDEITPRRVEEYRAARAAEVTPSTIRTELTHLIACLNWCAHPSRALIRKENVPYVPLPPAGQPRNRWLTTEELSVLFATAEANRPHGRMSRVEIFLWLALETAARLTAILELTWDRVDFETGMIDYDKPGRPKTKKRRANVAMSSRLRPVLERARAESKTELVVWHSSGIRRAMKVVADEAGIPGVTPNVLRHTAATHMARRGVPLWTVAAVLGNSVAIVEKVYAKHTPGAMREAVEKIWDGLPAEDED